MIDKINEILKGIDKDQCSSDDGWWETSSGAEFGANKLKEVQDLVHVKVNFPPFQHYRLDAETMSTPLVGKSHWKNGLKTGKFTATDGNITDKLARMYIMLCEKYAMKFNWRGYTYNDEMRQSAILQLTYVGLRFNEAKSANPFAYYTAAITNSFCRVLNSEKRNQNIRDDILEMNNLNPSHTRQHAGEWDAALRREGETPAK